jgi:hypothetical protein
MSDPTTVTVQDVEAAREQRRIALARIIAAELGGVGEGRLRRATA